MLSTHRPLRNGRPFTALIIFFLILAGGWGAVQPVQALSTTVVISQFQVAGGTAADEFIELHNISATDIDLNGYRLVYRSASGTSDVLLVTWTASTLLPAGGYYLLAATPGYDGSVAADITFGDGGSGRLAGASGGLALRDGTGTIVDSVGYGSATNEFVETSTTATPAANASRLRKGMGCQDTDNNANDFDAADPSAPRNSASPRHLCDLLPAPVLNEFVVNHTGTDTHEFVEIFGDPNTDYAAFAILQIEGDGAGAGVVDSVQGVGTSNAGGFWTTGFLNNAFENGTVSLLLVEGFSGSVGQDLDTNNDGVFDASPWSRIVDDVAVSDGGAGDQTYASTVLASGFGGSPFTPGGASRLPNGADTNTVADWTPNDFDGAGLPGFTGTPVFGEAINTPGAVNTPVLPALVINEIDYDQPSTDTAEFIEIKNNGSVDVNLDAVTIQLVNGNGGGAAVYQTIDLPSVNLAAGGYYVVCADALTVANCDLDITPDSNLIQNGAPDAAALLVNGVIVDAVSYEGDTGAPYTEGSGAGLIDSGAQAAESLSRCPDGVDTNQNNLDFVLVASTPGATNACAPTDTAPGVLGTTPADSAVDVALDANLTVDFSEAVNVAGSWFSITCSVSGAKTATVSGGPQTFTLDPDADFAGDESCTVTIMAANVTDQDAIDPPDTLAADYLFSFTTVAANACELGFTPVYAIQGNGTATTLAGQTITTQGVVVGDYEGSSPTLRGFYVQDATGDGDPATSDGIFVFNGNNNSVELGQVVRVTGTAAEFQDQTQLSNVSSVIDCGTGSVEPVSVTLPFPSADYPERYEGMLVQLPQTLYVTEHFQLGRFGQVVLSSGGRLLQPTHAATPGAAALALQAANNLNRIILDDALNNQNPDPILFGRGGDPLSASNTLRGGDTVSGIVGVLTYTWAGNAASGNAYRIRPVNSLGGGVPEFVPANPRPAQPDPVDGTLKAAAFNLLNYFNTFSGCTNGVGGAPTDCRGAESQTEFDRQWPKTVAAIVGLDADVLGIIEIENDGYGPTSAIADLVDRLNAATAAGTYAFIDVDAATGEVNALGTDAIKVGIVYKPGKVSPVGQTAVLNTDAFVNGGDNEPRNRPSLTQAFAQPNGEQFIVNVNHLKSKGSACNAPDVGDGQGNCNLVRTQAASELVTWLGNDPTGTGDPDVLILGDLNAYAQEDPVTTIKNAGYTNLLESLLGGSAYSYVFDGQWGYLDHALASNSLTSQVTGVTEWHVNADEPNVLDYNTNFKSPGQVDSLYAPDAFRMSDHDPVLVGLCLRGTPPPLTVTVTPDTLWPPKHQYVTVTASAASSDPDAVISFVSVTSNEPDNGLGDGDTTNDIVILSDYSFDLRAERAGNGTGRIYTITYEAVDECGDRTEASATVSVPLNKGRSDDGSGEDGDVLDENSQHNHIFLPSVTR